MSAPMLPIEERALSQSEHPEADCPLATPIKDEDESLVTAPRMGSVGVDSGLRLIASFGAGLISPDIPHAQAGFTAAESMHANSWSPDIESPITAASGPPSHTIRQQPR